MKLLFLSLIFCALIISIWVLFLKNILIQPAKVIEVENRTKQPIEIRCKSDPEFHNFHEVSPGETGTACVTMNIFEAKIEVRKVNDKKSILLSVPRNTVLQKPSYKFMIKDSSFF